MATPTPPAGAPSPAQIQTMQRQLAADAAKNNMTIEQYVTHLKTQAMKHAQQQQQQQQQGQNGEPHQHGGPQQTQTHVPINGAGPPNPKALAVAKWLRSQNLKTRTCILNGERKDMFKVKRALRALQSPAYATASQKNPSLLPPAPTRAAAEEVFKLLPLSLLALRVTKIDPHAGHDHGPTKTPAKKRVKGLWTVKIEQQQEVQDTIHFAWLYEGPQWKTKLYAAGALVLIMAVVLFPLWPVKLRIGVWYLSMGLLGLIGLFFAMALLRLILFCVTVFAVPPGLWLYPNLFEDVGFFDSFRPVWGWQEDKKPKKSKKSTKQPSASTATATPSTDSTVTPSTTPQPNLTTTTTTTTGAQPTPSSSAAEKRRNLTPRVEEVEDD
ncbi:MAG: Translocation protein S62 [Caeruleum heppii]|nr:MAG: Translocation protein S62 [Caeruleum heppii]